MLVDKNITTEVLWKEELHDDSNECNPATDFSPATNWQQYHYLDICSTWF
jgi:hypothetical protein